MMNKRKHSIFLMLQNNTGFTLPVTLLNQSSLNGSIANAKRIYEWDITSAVYSPLTFNIEVRFSVTSLYQNYGGTIAAANPNALIAALNNLNIGAFWIETSGPNTYVVTYNNNIIYRNLSIGTMTTTVTYVNTTVVPGGFMTIDVNAVNVVNSLNPGSFISGVLNLIGGDLVDVNVTSSPAENTPFLVSRTPVQPPPFSQVLHTNTVLGSASDSFSFNVDMDYTYNIYWGIPPP